MDPQKTDLRIIKTRNVLYRTLLDLMKESPFENIKVSDICNKALINRSTFYVHYKDKYELLTSYINDLKGSLCQELKKNKKISNSKEYYLEMLKLFFNHIEEKKDIYLSIMINNRNSIMMDILYDVLDHDIKKNLQKEDLKKNIVPEDILSKFYLGAVFNVAMEWLMNPTYSKETLISYLTILIPDDLNRK